MGTRQLLERLYNKPLEEILKHFYLEQDMTMEQVAKEMSVSVGSVVNWLNQYGIVKQHGLFNETNQKWKGDMKT